MKWTSEVQFPSWEVVSLCCLVLPSKFSWLVTTTHGLVADLNACSMHNLATTLFTIDEDHFKNFPHDLHFRKKKKENKERLNPEHKNNWAEHQGLSTLNHLTPPFFSLYPGHWGFPKPLFSEERDIIKALCAQGVGFFNNWKVVLLHTYRLPRTSSTRGLKASPNRITPWNNLGGTLQDTPKRPSRKLRGVSDDILSCFGSLQFFFHRKTTIEHFKHRIGTNAWQTTILKRHSL